MPRLVKQKRGSSFVRPYSSFSRQTVYFTFILLLFPSMSLSQIAKGTKICFDTRKGHRLETTVYKKLRAWNDIDCVVRCVNDSCCRSVNFLKILDKENCELLHDAVVSGKNNNLLKTDGNYDYFILNNPARSFNCDCVSCEYNKTCIANSEKCECPSGFTGAQCEHDDCQVNFEHVGCYKDTSQPLNKYILSDKDPTISIYSGISVNWNNFGPYIRGFACRCAQKAVEKGYTTFGLQNYGECWSGEEANVTYMRDGPSTDCVNATFQECTNVKFCVGIEKTNYVYLIKTV